MTYTPKQRKAALLYIVCFGLVSLFADMTYEGARGVIGPFMMNLGASAVVVGFVAGFGEMVAASLRFFSGKLADRTHAYWTMTVAGYAMTVAVVPLLAFVNNWQMAALIVVTERTGKALRGPSRDVLLSEATGVVGHGFGFGLHGAMDKAGGVLGPLLMAAVIARTKHIGPAFLALGIPAVLAMLSIYLALRDASRQGNGSAAPGGAGGHPEGVLDVRGRRRAAGDGIPGLPVARISLREDGAVQARGHPVVVRRGNGDERNHRARVRTPLRPLRNSRALIRHRALDPDAAARAAVRAGRRPC